MKQTVRIPAANRAAVESQFSKLNKRAAKLGVDPLMVSFSDRISEKKRDSESGHDRVYHFYDLTVEGETPIINGWVMVSFIEREAGDINIIDSLNDVISTPKKYWKSAPYCEHCHTHRVKKYSYIIYNPETKEYKQVGKSCIKDFFDKDIESYLKWFQHVWEIMDSMEDADYWGGSAYVEPTHDIKYLLSVTAALVEEFGYVKTSDDWDKMPTRDQVRWFLYGPGNYAPDSAKREWLEHVKKFEKLAKGKESLADEIIAWATTVEQTSEYIQNVAAIVNRGWAYDKNLGYVVSMVPVFMKVKEQNIKRKQREAIEYADEYAGKVKERKDFDVTVQFRRVFDGYYGQVEMLSMIDADNHAIIWFNSGRQVKPEAGATMKIKGTVKKLDVYNGIKQTHLSRVTVVEGAE